MKFKEFSPFPVIVSAIRTLTIIPIPGKDTQQFNHTLPIFPIIGLFIAFLMYGLDYLLHLVIPDFTLLNAILLALFSVILTGGLHLDGIADVSDAFGGGKNREHILTILKDSRLGTFGVSAIVFDLALKIILYDYFLKNKLFYPIILSIVISRLTQSIACISLPYTGTQSKMTSSFTNKSMTPWVIISTIVSVLAVLSYFRQWEFLLLFILPGFVVFIFLRWCKSKLDGITGDCIGALNEIIEITVLLFCVVFVNGTITLN